MNERLCRTCGNPIPLARLEAMPSAVQCVPCLVENGDEPPIKGHMVWDHKTAPKIEIGTKLAANSPDQHPRTARTTQSLPTSRRWDVEGLVVNTRTARCHPDRHAISSSGLCAECAIKWYAQRLWH